MHVTIVSQPDNGHRLGDILVAFLNRTEDWQAFRAVVAFLKNSGARHLEEPLRRFVAASRAVEFIIGIDHEGTSADGLRTILRALEPTGRAWVFHNRSRSTFHPKFYLFEGVNEAAVIVGSGNITQGGLYTNYEAHVLIELDLSQEADVRVLADAQAYVDGLINAGNGLIHRLDMRLIEELGGLTPTEGDARDEPDEPEDGTGDAQPGQIAERFGNVRVRNAPQLPTRGGAALQGPGRPGPMGGGQVVRARRGELIWDKRLSATDAQSQVGNPTGNLRLSAARFRFRGQAIQSQTHFRQTLFGHLPWAVVQATPHQEQTFVDFEVTVLGIDMGRHRLRLSHQPSRIAYQGNVPTVLHWGDQLIARIPWRDVVGQWVRLYAPPPGATEPHYLEIELG